MTFTEVLPWDREYLYILTAVLRGGAAVTHTLIVFRTITKHSLTSTTELCIKKESLCGSRESELMKVGEHRLERITVGNQLPPEVTFESLLKLLIDINKWY